MKKAVKDKKEKAPRQKVSLKEMFSTKGTRAGGYSVAACAVVIAIAIVLNVAVKAIPTTYTSLDTTAESVFSVSDETKQIVSALTQEVDIYYLHQASGDDDTYVSGLLDKYASLSPELKVTKKDPDVYPQFASQYTTDEITNNDIIVVCGTKYKHIANADMYEQDYSSYYTTGSATTSFAGENAITSAIDLVTSDLTPAVYTLTGHDETALDSTFSSDLEGRNYTVTDLNLLTDTIPEDCACLMILSPQKDLSAEETKLILQYVRDGGDLYITTAYTSTAQPNFESILSACGLSLTRGIVMDIASSHYYRYPYYLLPDKESHEITDPIIDKGYYILFPQSQGLTISDTLPDGVTADQLLASSDSAYVKTDPENMQTYSKEDGDVDGPFTLGAAVTIDASSGTADGTDDSTTQASSTAQSKIVVFGSDAFMSSTTDEYVQGANSDLFLNSISWICGKTSSVSIHAKSLSSDKLTVSDASANMYSVLMIGIIPAVFLAVGVFIWVKRKYNKA